MGTCKSCKSNDLTVDNVTGNLECSSCGAVQDFTNYEEQTYNIDGPIGTNVRLGKSGSGCDYSYRETKIYLAQKIVSEILYELNFESRVDEVNNMIRIITEEEYGSGKWFNVLVGACIYVVMRKANKWMPLTSLCNSVGCDHHELGRMVYRVIEHLDLTLPDFDIVGLFDRVITEWVTCRDNIGKDKLSRMVKQGIFLLQCMIKWYVTTGRRPVPVVVAVIVFVCELNNVEISLEDLASRLNVKVVTCKLRYNELLKRLIEVAKVNLPWGTDVNIKNIMKNTPIILQYMELKSMRSPGNEIKSLEEVGVDLGDLVKDCLKKRNYYIEDYESSDNNSNNNKSQGLINWDLADLETLNISPECLSTIYLKYLDEYSKVKTTIGKANDNRVIKKSDFFIDTLDYWTGDSDLSKKLFLDKILEKDVGLNVMPPSFINGNLKKKRRKEKIKAAKIRIAKIRRRPVAADGGGGGGDICLVSSQKRKRRGKKAEMDWEDFVIETLLLHEVKEDEIEKGYYNTLLDLHVFNSGSV